MANYGFVSKSTGGGSGPYNPSDPKLDRDQGGVVTDDPYRASSTVSRPPTLTGGTTASAFPKSTGGTGPYNPYPSPGDQAGGGFDSGGGSVGGTGSLGKPGSAFPAPGNPTFPKNTGGSGPYQWPGDQTGGGFDKADAGLGTGPYNPYPSPGDQAGGGPAWPTPLESFTPGQFDFSNYEMPQYNPYTPSNTPMPGFPQPYSQPYPSGGAMGGGSAPGDYGGMPSTGPPASTGGPMLPNGNMPIGPSYPSLEAAVAAGGYGGGGSGPYAGPALTNSDGSLNSGFFGGQDINTISQPTSGYEWFGDENVQNALQTYTNFMLPGQQAEYNQALQNREFSESVRRFNQEFGQTQWRDQQEMDLALSQFGLEEWGAQIAAAQFQQNFGLESQSRDRQYQLDIQAQNLQQAYQQGLIGNQEYANETGRIEAEYQNTYNMGRLDNDRYGIDVQHQYNQGRLQVDQQMAGIEQQKTEVDQMYKSGLINNQQREIALAELAQQQNEAFRYSQMGQQESQFGRTLASTDAWRGTQAELQREQMETSKQNTIMQQWGRNQAPNVRWLG